MTKCECGCSSWECKNFPRQHRKLHKLWANGALLPRKMEEPDDSILIVPANGPSHAVRFAHKMSSIAHRTLPFDFNSFAIGRQALLQDWREYNTKAFLAVELRMAIGYLVTRLVSKWATVCLDYTGRTVPIKNHEMRRPRIELIFVCSNHRRQGIGTKLVLAAAENHGVTPQEMVWQSPLEEVALPLARKFSNKGMLYAT